MDQMANNRVMRELISNIDELKAEVMEYRNNAKYLPYGKKRKRKKKSKNRKSSVEELDPYRIIEEDIMSDQKQRAMT